MDPLKELEYLRKLKEQAEEILLLRRLLQLDDDENPRGPFECR